MRTDGGEELSRKLAAVRRCLKAAGLGGVRLRGLVLLTLRRLEDVVLTTDTGVAEVFITSDTRGCSPTGIEGPRLLKKSCPRASKSGPGRRRI